MPKHPHILNAASNLLGIALVLITGLHVSRFARGGFADEIAWVAALLLALSCLASYLALRSDREASRFESVADIAFLSGLLSLIIAVLLVALQSA